MDRNEAIDRLQYMKNYKVADNEAIDMAILALSAEHKDCTDFLCWLLEEIMDEENWEMNAVANGEIIARKLKKLGLLDSKDGYYIRTPMYEALTEPSELIKQETIKELCDWLEQMIQHGVPSHSAKRKALANAIALLSMDTHEIHTETHECVKETHDSDLISRADALKTIEEWACSAEWEYTNATDYLKKRINNIPSASVPQGDLISRADALREMAQAECGVNYEHCCEEDCTCSYIQRILDLPSVSVESKATENKYDCDLISRAELLRELLNTTMYLGNATDFNYMIPIISVKSIIANAPSVSAERVGEWEYDVDADDSFCTNCHKYAIRDMEMQLESDFCPNCGARMENKK